MHRTGVLTYELADNVKLHKHGLLVVANHPSLIDVIFIGCQMQDAMYVVKEAAWTNPFLAMVVHATGYIPNSDAETMMKRCADHLLSGGSLVLFPEGTRTVPGHAMHFYRGAAAIAVKAQHDITPVYLNIAPPTLGKGVPWYSIPPERAKFSMTVGKTVKIAEYEEMGISYRRKFRKLNEFLVLDFEKMCKILYGNTNGKLDS
jgi:1-acyl-sn-glycerol-3-phosphate acyltransferase